MKHGSWAAIPDCADTEPAMNGTSPRPTEIKVRQSEKTLEISFDDGTAFSLPAEYLRVESPSAEVQGHGPGQKVLVAGRRHVGIANVEPVGNYAIRIDFDDLHDTGIFSWRYLYQLGAEFEVRWNAYTEAIDRDGLSRDP
jgi:DUF971 family protein